MWYRSFTKGKMEEGQYEANPQFATPAPKKKINKRFIYLLVIVIFLILAFVGYKALGSKNSNNIQTLSAPTPTIPQAPTDTLVPTETSSSPTPSPKPTAKPILTDTPTPAVTSTPIDKTTGLDRSKLTVTVENGSGEAGVAGSGKDFLSGLGYDVTATDNADNFDYTGVTIQVKSASSNYLALLKKDLAGKYTITSATSDLPNSNSSDAVVIIGK